MEVIALANHKGGVSKTSTALAIGTGLSLKGYRVLFVDMDAQSNLTFSLGIINPPISTLDVLTGEATAKEAIQHIDEKQDLIPATINLAIVDAYRINKDQKEYSTTEYTLRDALKPLQRKYDYCIIDTPPAIGLLTVTALTACNSVIIPTQADTFSLQGIALLNNTLETIKEYTNPKLKIKGILITNNESNTLLSRGLTADIRTVADFLNTKCFNTTIRKNVVVKEAQARQKSIFEYAPKSNATADYTALVEEILQG